MARSLASIKKATFVWDFAVDGGLVGTINLGTFIPANAQLMMFGVDVITTITGNIGAVIHFGLVGRPDAFMASKLYSNVTVGIFQICNEAATKVASGLECMMTIGSNTLTAGKTACTVTYIENIA